MGDSEVLPGEAGGGRRALAVVGQREECDVEPTPVPVTREANKRADARVPHGEAVQRQHRTAGASGLVDPVLQEDWAVARRKLSVEGGVVALDAVRDHLPALDATPEAALHAQRVRRLVQEVEEAARVRLQLGREHGLRRFAKGFEIFRIGDQRPLHHELHRAQHGAVERRTESGEEPVRPALGRKLGRQEARELAVTDRCFHPVHGDPIATRCLLPKYWSVAIVRRVRATLG